MWVRVLRAPEVAWNHNQVSAGRACIGEYTGINAFVGVVGRTWLDSKFGRCGGRVDEAKEHLPFSFTISIPPVLPFVPSYLNVWVAT